MQDDKDKDKGLTKLDPAGIRALFNRNKEEFRSFTERSGIAKAIAGMSEIISDLRDAGIDVSLEMMGGASEQAFDLFKENGVTVPVSGILRIGPIHRLVAIATKLNKEETTVIALSEFDIRYSGPEAVVRDGIIDGKLRSVRFDIKKDPEALAKLEKTIINYAARNEVLADLDEFGALENKKGVLPKPSLKIPPATP